MNLMGSDASCNQAIRMQATDDLIRRDLIAFYQKAFGHKWMSSIHKPIVPSPIRFLSVVYQVPIDYVHSVYNQMVVQFKSSPGLNASY
jgi:hypothetical protein